MSFFKRLVPLNAQMKLTLQSLTVEQGQPFKGTAVLEAKDEFGVQEVRMEIRVREAYIELATLRDGRGAMRQVSQRRHDVRYSQDVPVSQEFDMRRGDRKEFPFEVTIPMHFPSRYGGSIDYEIKAVANVKGRPDVTHSVSPMIMPSTGVTKVIEREVIKVPCRYCGTLVELRTGVNKCSSCGAAIKLG